jgi:hypothetical protein
MHFKGEFPFAGTTGEAPMTVTDKLKYLRMHIGSLNEWEKGFVENVSTFTRPTQKQVAVIDKLFDKLAREEF